MVGLDFQHLHRHLINFVLLIRLVVGWVWVLYPIQLAMMTPLTGLNNLKR